MEKFSWRVRKNACDTLYEYEVHKIPDISHLLRRFPDDVEGNYIFARPNEKAMSNDYKWRAVYIGQGKLKNQADLTNRTDEKVVQCIKQNNATHIHILIQPDKHMRVEQERRLLGYYNTLCNVQQQRST